MADQGGDADKTEQPTRKRLRDARRDGEVAKSKEVTSTAVLGAWLVIFAVASPFIYTRVARLFALAFDSIATPGTAALAQMGDAALDAFAAVSIPLLLAAGAAGTLAEFLQAGPILAIKRVTPDASRLSPGQGVKKMFSMDNLVELAKGIGKTALLVAITAVVLWSLAGDLLRLPNATPGAFGDAMKGGAFRLAGWILAVFVGVSILDWAYQRYAFIKRHRMSRAEIKRETREDEGDPMLRGKRKQLHQEWATRNVLESVKTSSVVVTNPTHVAVALLYDPAETAVPVVTAKGEDHMAALIRRAAEEAGVPIMRNVDLARGLNERVEVDDYIPAEFFEAVAEVLRWAAAVKASADGGGSEQPS